MWGPTRRTILILPLSASHVRSRRALWFVARVALLVALAWLYLAGATEHARVVNTSKARGDQSGYLWDAQQVYANWHGRTPPVLVGERMRMPVYAAYLSLFYTPRMSDPEFFDVAKTWNIRLSLFLLALLCVIFSWHLPPLASTNLSLIVAFGYFVFKAGYSQPELLFYFLFFTTFLACCHLLRHRGPAVSLFLGILAGTLAAMAYLTKAVVPPFVALFVVVYATHEVVLLAQHWQRGDARSRRDALRRFAWRAAAGTVMVICFLGVVYPYIANNKRVFGHWFYNVNTTFYIWYDDGARARAEMLPHSDQEGRVTLPPVQLPSLRKYWRTHTVGQILDRVAGGLRDMIVRSYTTYWYLKYVVVYTAFALALIAANWRPFVRMIHEHAALCAFLVLYAAVYLPATAFFAPTSSTGTTRFLLAHVAPLLFVLSYFFACPPFRGTRWTIGAVDVTPAHFHVLVFVTMGLDLTFTLWPRLLTTYGGF